MSDQTEYIKALAEGIEAKRHSLDKDEIVKLKEKLRAFQTAYNSLYSLLLRKAFIKEDPYKGEAKAGEIVVPSNASFTEHERDEQMSIRLAAYDNQLDFLVNFYNFNVEFCTLERIKLILGLVKYIDWVNLSATSESPTTAGIGSLINQLRSSHDNIGTKIVTGVTTTLSQLTSSIMADLKVLTAFSREVYKLEVREALDGKIPQGKTPTVTDVKKIFGTAKLALPFYSELINEMLKEDYSPEGQALRDKVVKNMAVVEKKEVASVKQQQEFSGKPVLIEGIVIIGSVSNTLHEVSEKLDENKSVLEKRKVNLWIKIRRVFEQAFNKTPEPTYYEVEYSESEGKSIKRKVNFDSLQDSIEKKARNLAVAGSNTKLLENLEEEKLIEFLERAIKELKVLHKTLNALDDFFKNTVTPEDRNKVKGIKPELATIKNTFVRANEKFAEYLNIKEEEEQFKRLGITNTAG